MAALQDAKEYRTTLELLESIGPIPALLNKLNKLTLNTGDTELRDHLGAISSYILRASSWAKNREFRVLSSLHRGDMMHLADYIEYKNRVLFLQKYCIDCIALQVPQWQIIATANNWGPLPTPKA